jgi:response regulator RpfG family c-di-GMP phosphodiesterase
VRSLLLGDLGARFAGDYELEAYETRDAAIAALRRDADEGRRVALVLGESPAPGSAELLAAAHELHPHARRVLLVARGAWKEEHPAVAAMRSGQADSYVFVPWVSASGGCTCP